MTKKQELRQALKDDPDLLDALLNDWDYQYLLHIMHWKLARMEKCIRSGHFVRCEKVAHDINIAKNLLHRLLDMDYRNPKYDKAITDWWATKVEVDIGNDLIRLDFEESPEREKICAQGAAAAHALEEQDWNYLFKILARKMRRWWD